MKKITVMLLCGMLVLCSGCGSNTPDNSQNVTDIQETTDNNDTIEDTSDNKEEASKEDTDDNQDEVVNEVEENEKDDSVSVADIYAEIETSVELISPMILSDDFIFNYYGVDTSALEDYIFVMSEESISAETVIIVNAGENGDLDAITSSLQTIIDEKAIEMDNYLPDEYDIVASSSVNVKGQFVTVVISHNASDIQAVIDKYIQ